MGINSGSIFFEHVILGVRSGQDLDYAGWIQIGDRDIHLRGGGIVRLGALTSYVSSKLDKLGINPLTKSPFPQLKTGKLESNGGKWGGLFSFWALRKR
jgi:hypothetical protein